MLRGTEVRGRIGVVDARIEATLEILLAQCSALLILLLVAFEACEVLPHDGRALV